MIKIFVDKEVISKNRFHGTNEAPIIVDEDGVETPTNGVSVYDSLGNLVARVVHDPSTSHRAKVWVQVEGSGMIKKDQES